jgi:hypothetical protein
LILGSESVQPPCTDFSRPRVYGRGSGGVEGSEAFSGRATQRLWQSDMMYGPMVRVEGCQRRTFLFAFLDDMSRLNPHAQFYLSERLESYLDCPRQALLRRGLPRKPYVYNRPAFRSQHLSQITAVPDYSILRDCLGPFDSPNPKVEGRWDHRFGQ